MNKTKRTKRTKQTNRTNQINKTILGGKGKGKGKEFRKMNCHPAVKNKTATPETCYTPEILHKLKHAHNTKDTTNPITVNEPKQIVEELKTKLMPKCAKEDCWLDELVNHPEKKKIDEETFAPDQPLDWKGKKNPWLSNFDILKVLSQYEKPYPHFKMVGPTPIDFDDKPQGPNGPCVWEDLCKFSIKKYKDDGKTKIGIVFNLDEHDEKGSHWVSMFIDLEHNFIFFLDSAGDTIPDEIKKFVERITEEAKGHGITLTFHENAPTEHQTGESECGMYALYFITTMLSQEKVELTKDTKEEKKEKFNHHHDAIKFFKEKRIPDNVIYPFRDKFFNIPDSFLNK